MNDYVVSPEALLDIFRIWDHIAQDSIANADRFTEELESTFVRLAEWPGIGHERTDLADETLRVWTLQSYLIIYRPTSRPLEIVRVVSGYRDLVSLFERPQR